jgi:hypothetical protein
MPELFTPAAYGALLESLFARGYDVRGYQDAEPAKRHLVLRHDIDMSLRAALPIAEVERGLGVKATYFVLLRSEMYNPLSSVSCLALKQLRALGHEIGLHFDAAPHGDALRALDSAATDECEFLERLLGHDVRVISFHRPAPALLGYPHRLAGRRHAYEPRFFRDMGYCSDSRGAWGNGHPLEHPAVQNGGALQLLTHPIWWTSEAGEGVQSRLDRFARDRYRLLRAELSANCETYDSTLPPSPAPL